MFDWLRQRSIRSREAVILRHLGFLIHEYGGVLSVISDAHFCIEFGNVALDHHRHFNGDTEAFLAPAYDQVKRHRLDVVLRFLGESPSDQQGLALLAERLRPYSAELNRRFSRTQYPLFREELERYCFGIGEPI